MANDDEPARVTIGQPVYDEDGNEVGTIRGFDQDGFFVTTRQGIEALSVEHEHTSGTLGEAELMWRCSNCGEMAPIEQDLPETCPNCDGPREDIYYWTED